MSAEVSVEELSAQFDEIYHEAKSWARHALIIGFVFGLIFGFTAGFWIEKAL